MGMLACTRTWGYSIGLIAVFAALLAVSLRPAFRKGARMGRMPLFYWATLVLAGWVLIRATWAPVPLAARWDALKWTAVAGMLWAWTQLARERGAWRILLGGVFLLVAAECLYGLLQHVNGSNMVLWMPRPEQYGARVSGTFICPNHFANVAAMTIPAAAAVLLTRGAGLPLKLLAGYTLAAALPVLYWSLSRSAWLGAAGGLAVTALGVLWRRNRAWFLIGLVAAPLVLAGAGAVAWKTLPGVRQRMGLIRDNRGGDYGSGGRPDMWKDSLVMWKDARWCGFGGGSFEWAFPKYQHHANLDLYYNYPHNEYVQTLVEYGAVGLGLLGVAGLVFGLESLWALRRGRRDGDGYAGGDGGGTGAALLAGAAGAVASGGIHAFFDFNFHIFPNPHVLVALVGIAWGGWMAEEGGAEPERRRAGPWVRRAAGVALAVAWVWCGWLALKGGMSYWRWLRGEEARAQGAWEIAESHYRRSMAWDDRNAAPWVGLAGLRTSQATWYRNPDPEAQARGRDERAAEAERCFRAALERNPLEVDAVYGVGRTLKARGDEEGALEWYRKAAELQPWRRYFAAQVGFQLRSLERYDEAFEWAQRLCDEKRSSPQNDRNWHWLSKKLGR